MIKLFKSVLLKKFHKEVLILRGVIERKSFNWVNYVNWPLTSLVILDNLSINASRNKSHDLSAPLYHARNLRVRGVCFSSVKKKKRSCSFSSTMPRRKKAKNKTRSAQIGLKN